MVNGRLERNQRTDDGQTEHSRAGPGGTGGDERKWQSRANWSGAEVEDETQQRTNNTEQATERVTRGRTLLWVGIAFFGFEPLLNYAAFGGDPLLVELTLIQSAAAKGAVCLDGSLPGYHLHRGSGSGANSWLIHLEGGGACDSVQSCVHRKTTPLGSSRFMKKEIPFAGILNNMNTANPDFYNWNRVKIRYCDGACFAGDSSVEAAKLQFRGQRIWLAAMEELMSTGMHNAHQVLLSGCSAGSVGVILHCDELRNMFPGTTKVKCLSDAGLFLDVKDISGKRTFRKFFSDVINLHQVHANFSCSSNCLDQTPCLLPENVISSIRTPMFLLNSAYDTWQISNSIAPISADPKSDWSGCKSNHSWCSDQQINFLQGFRERMLHVIKDFSKSSQNGLFINSCFGHCQSDRQDTWFADDSPTIGNKAIAKAVGDWYFNRAVVKAIDCAYPCDDTCHNLDS